MMKIGIVGGYGSIGTKHATNARAIGHSVVIYDPARQSDFKFERELYDSDVDAVVIATPTRFHEQAVRACVERGKHMLIEKPIGLAVGALPDLLNQAKLKQLVVMMGNMLRFHPCIKQFKLWIEENAFGPPLWASFQCAVIAQSSALMEGALMSNGAHEVDLALHLLGPATVLSKGYQNHDVSSFVLGHRVPCYSCFHLDIQTLFRSRRFTIAFEKKTIHADLDQRRVEGSIAFSHGGHYPGGYNDDYLAEMKAFTNRINGHPIKPAATGDDGLATLQLLAELAA